MGNTASSDRNLKNQRSSDSMESSRKGQDQTSPKAHDKGISSPKHNFLSRGKQISPNISSTKKFFRHSIAINPNKESQPKPAATFGWGLQDPVVGSPLVEQLSASFETKKNIKIPKRANQEIKKIELTSFAPIDVIPETFVPNSGMGALFNQDSNTVPPKLSESNEAGKQECLISTLIKWEDPAESVYISGSFNEWKYKIKLKKNDFEGDWSTMLKLPVGMHSLKFIVDGEWQYSRTMLTAPDDDGNLVNYIKVEEVFMDLSNQENHTENVEGIDSATLSGSPPGEYTNIIPDPMVIASYRDSNFRKIEPPLLPPHLNQVLLNSPSSDQPGMYTLPVPNHVVLNHLYACSIKDNVMAISSSTRYRKKYVTTVYYRPVLR